MIKDRDFMVMYCAIPQNTSDFDIVPLIRRGYRRLDFFPRQQKRKIIAVDDESAPTAAIIENSRSRLAFLVPKACKVVREVSIPSAGR